MATTICLSFDIDAYGPALFVGDRNASVLSRGEFDTQVAVPRILALLAGYELPATFFVPGHTADCFPATIEGIVRAGHEIAHHGYLHEPPAQLSAEQEAEALGKGIRSLERITGERPRGYRAPLWEPSAGTIELLVEQGFAYDSSLMATDFMPYRARTGDRITADGATFGRESEIVELPSSWVFDDWSYFANARRPGGGGPTPPSHVLEIWSEQVAFAAESVQDGVVVITLHPQVSGQGYVLRMLRQFLDRVVADDQLRVESMGRAAEAWRGRTTGSPPPAS